LNHEFVVKFLVECRPACPVIISSSDSSKASAMESELLVADWIVERVGPDVEAWVQTVWLPKAQELLATHRNTWPGRSSTDHQDRMQRALLSLDGLSVGDAFGERFFGNPRVAERRIEHRDPPPPPWAYSDDTAMALSIVRCLKRYREIDREA